MALSIAEIRAKLAAQDKKAEGAQNGGFSNEPNAFLAHWNIPEGVPLNLRILPDGNPSNDFFWKERDMINLTFTGIKGGEQKPVKVVVPCNEMWGPINSCPVLKEVREWYKSKDQAVLDQAQKYWKKKSYLMQVFIAPDSCAVEGDVPPENPIRRIMLNKVLFTKIKSILMNVKIPHLPTDFDHGRDFAIVKGKNGGGFAEYDSSQWDMYERPLNEMERAAIAQYGLFDLNEFMPKQPTDAELNAISEMFQASVNGEQYDPARWGQFYRPAGLQIGNVPQGTAPTPTATPAVQTPVTPVSTPVQPAATESAVASSALSALAALRPAAAAPATESAPAEATTRATTSSTADLLASLMKNKQ